MNSLDTAMIFSCISITVVSIIAVVTVAIAIYRLKKEHAEKLFKRNAFVGNFLADGNIEVYDYDNCCWYKKVKIIVNEDNGVKNITIKRESGSMLFEIIITP